MKQYRQFIDFEYDGIAIDSLNEFIKLNTNYNVIIEGFQVVRYEFNNNERTHILISYEEREEANE